MNAKQIGLSLALLAFGGVEAYAVWQVGYVGVFEQALGSVGAVLGFVDLCIALGLGSVGPLLYLIRREGRESAGVLRAARAS